MRCSFASSAFLNPKAKLRAGREDFSSQKISGSIQHILGWMNTTESLPLIVHLTTSYLFCPVGQLLQTAAEYCNSQAALGWGEVINLYLSHFWEFHGPDLYWIPD